MMKKVLAITLSGIMVLGGSMSVFAADGAESEAAASTAESAVSTAESAAAESSEDASLESMLGDLLGALGSEEEDPVGSLLGSLGVEEGSLDALAEGLGASELLGALTGEDSFDLGSFLEGFDVGSTLGSIYGALETLGTEEFTWDAESVKELAGALGIEMSDEEAHDLVELANDPEAEDKLVAKLFAKGGICAAILDSIGSKGGAIGTVIESMKNEDGDYDVEKITTSMEEAEEKENSIVINGTEITQDDLAAAIEDVMTMLGVTEEAAGSEAEAVESEAAESAAA
jgi:hypothetical protein